MQYPASVEYYIKQNVETKTVNTLQQYAQMH